MPDDSLWSPAVSAADQQPPPLPPARPQGVEGRSIGSAHHSQSLLGGTEDAEAPEVVVVVHEKDQPLPDKSPAPRPQLRPQRQAVLQSWWDAVAGAAGGAGGPEAFPRSRDPEGLPRAEGGRDLFGPDRRQTLATISETLGAINTVGRYLVNYTRGNSSGGQGSAGGGGGGGGGGLGLATTLLGTPTVLSDGTEHDQ